MIKRQTVFVVGAGASAPFGFPTGRALVDQIATALSADSLIKSQIRSAGFDEYSLSDFAHRLVQSSSMSVDVFLERSDSKTVDMGTLAIALTMLEHERRAREEGRVVGTGTPGDHWLKYLWSLMQPESTAGNMAENKVAFVTFNYDRTIEYFFAEAFRALFRLGQQEAELLRVRALPVLHLHGQIAGRQYGQGFGDEMGPHLINAAATIRVVTDPSIPSDPVYADAHALLAKADMIVLLGFGFHPVNVERLGVATRRRSGAGLIASTFGMGASEVKMAMHLLNSACETGALSAEAFLREHAWLL